MDDHSSGRAVARTLWLPTRIFGGEAPPAMAARSLFGIAPGGACRAGSVARPAVGSYPTVSPLPGVSRWRTFGIAGGLISVALSVGLLRPGVTRHRCFKESGLSSNGISPAVIRPSARDL